MPIYEYECEKCGKIVEAMQKFSDDPLTTCESCNGSLHKLISRSSFHLKGSGWYVTDYSGKKQDTTTKSTDSTSTKVETKTETKSADTAKPGDSK